MSRLKLLFPNILILFLTIIIYRTSSFLRPLWPHSATGNRRRWGVCQCEFYSLSSDANVPAVRFESVRARPSAVDSGPLSELLNIVSAAESIGLAVARAAVVLPSVASKQVSAVRRALQRDCAVARPREYQHHPPLRRGRPRDEAEGTRPAGSTSHQDTAVPRVR